MNISQLGIIGTHFISFLVILYYLANRRNFGKVLTPFSKFLYLSGIIHAISLIAWFYKLNNMYLLHFYVPTSTLLLLGFYKELLGDFINHRFFKITAISFVIFCVLNTVFLQNFWSFNSYALTIQSIIISILSLSTFKWVMHEDIREKYRKDLPTLNWINSGLFIYYSSNLIIFYFGELIMHTISIEYSKQTWLLHSFFSTVMYFCFFKGLWKNRQQ